MSTKSRFDMDEINKPKKMSKNIPRSVQKIIHLFRKVDSDQVIRILQFRMV